MGKTNHQAELWRRKYRKSQRDLKSAASASPEAIKRARTQAMLEGFTRGMVAGIQAAREAQKNPAALAQLNMWAAMAERLLRADSKCG